MHLSEKMDWDFFCYCTAFCFLPFFFPLLNLCQFNTKHFQLGFKRSVEIYWLPKWIVNGIGCWERPVLLLPFVILHYIKMGLLLNAILRCQCFLQALIFIFFLSCLPSSHRRFLHDCLLTLLFHEAVDLQTGAGSAHTLSPARSHEDSAKQSLGL